MHMASSSTATTCRRLQDVKAGYYEGLTHQWGGLQDLLGQRDAARERLLHGMEERRYTALLDDLVAAAPAPAVLPEAAGLASEASPPLVAKAWRRLRKAVKRAGATPSDEALHQIRIRAKRARYAAEAWLRERPAPREVPRFWPPASSSPPSGPPRRPPGSRDDWDHLPAAAGGLSPSPLRKARSSAASSSGASSAM